MPPTAATPLDSRDAFFRLIGAVVKRRDFEVRERQYKLRLGGKLAVLAAAADQRPRVWGEKFLGVLRSPDDNMINWRQVSVLAERCARHPGRLRDAFVALVDERDPVDSRTQAFGAFLSTCGLEQVGAQLTIGSTLLMASGAEAHPPIRTQPFQKAFTRCGYPDFGARSAPERYAHAIGFLDWMGARAGAYGVSLRDRLDAQSAVWWIRDAESPGDLEEDAGEEHYFDEYPELDVLDQTQREAITAVRIGQGRFRDGLLAQWGACAVTGCDALPLLRASHIKPWSKSSSAERLDPFNGLLLVPNLDAALDRGLMSFADDGRVIFSPELSGDARNALGLSQGMTLRKHPDGRHIPFLRYHRENVLRR